jgi:Ham1 family
LSNTFAPASSKSVKLRVLKVDLPEIQEVDTEGIAKEKVMLAAQLANGPAICEDTSLEFHALGGAKKGKIKKNTRCCGVKFMTSLYDSCVCFLSMNFCRSTWPIHQGAITSSDYHQ